MEWQQLVGFSQVAKLGSFTKAGQVTCRSQSALSQQVKALEEELDCRLLERIGKRKISLTPAGEALRRFADGLMNDYERLRDEMNALKSLQKGRLRLAAPFTTLYHLFRQPLTGFVERFPQVQLTVLDRSQSQVIDLVKEGEVDFGVALVSLVPRDLAARRWQQVETVALAPQGHPLTRFKRVSLRHLARYPLILPPAGPRGRGRQGLEERLRRLGLPYRVVMESSNVELSSLYVEMGLGVSLATVASDLPVPAGRNLAFLPLSRYFKPDWLAVVTRRDKSPTAPMQAFLEMLLGPEGPGDERPFKKPPHLNPLPLQGERRE